MREKLGEFIDILLLDVVIPLNKRYEHLVDAVAHGTRRYGITKDRHVEISGEQWIFPRLVQLIRETLMVGAREGYDDCNHRDNCDSKPYEI